MIAKAGTPMVKVTAIDAPSHADQRRIGFLPGEISVPADFDEMGREEVERLFEAGP